MSKPKTPANVVPLFIPEDVEEDEVELGFDIKRAPAATSAGPVALDLTGLKKALLAVGSGNTGKTTGLRYICEMAFARQAKLFLAAVDPANRTLSNYFDGVLMPPSHVPAEMMKWLEEKPLRFVMSPQNEASLVADFGGGDTTIAQIIATMDLDAGLREAGVEPVLLYFVGPRIDDLSVLAAYDKAGFRPKATAIILNEGVAPETSGRDAFAGVLKHSIYRAAIERGAVPIWMPRLLPALEIERRRISYRQATLPTMPEGRKGSPLQVFDRSRVHHWLTAMAAAFEPIRSWLPE